MVAPVPCNTQGDPGTHAAVGHRAGDGVLLPLSGSWTGCGWYLRQPLVWLGLPPSALALTCSHSTFTSPLEILEIFLCYS